MDDKITLRYWCAVLFQIIEVNKGHKVKGKNKWLIDSESLIQKAALNSLSTFYLLEGTKPNIPEIKSTINFTDYLSIHAIVRSVLESYLVLHYIFGDDKVNTRIKKIRYKLWHASSLSQRQRHKVFTKKTKELLNSEKSNYLKLRREIINSKTFVKSITLEQKDKFLKKKAFDWKPVGGWLGIAKTGPLSEDYWVDIYNMLSATSHSNAVISNQLNNKDQRVIQQQFSSTATMILNLTIPLFIDSYAKIFPQVLSLLKEHPQWITHIELAKQDVRNYK